MQNEIHSYLSHEPVISPVSHPESSVGEEHDSLSAPLAVGEPALVAVAVGKEVLALALKLEKGCVSKIVYLELDMTKEITHHAVLKLANVSLSISRSRA